MGTLLEMLVDVTLHPTGNSGGGGAYRDWEGRHVERTVAVVNENDRAESAPTAGSDRPADVSDRVQAAAGSSGAADDSPARRPWRDILLYGLARLLLFVVLTVVIQSVAILLGMGQSFPLAISALLALIIAFPLSMFVFRGLRQRVNAQIAVWDAGRQKHRAEMRAQLEERLD